MSWSWPTAALGVLEPGLAYTFGIFGLQITQASVASLIMGTEPLLVLVIGALVFGVRVEKRSWCLALLGFLGIALMLEQGSSINSSLLGALLLVLGTGCAAFYVLLSGRLAQSIDPLSAAACQQTVALVFILIVFLLRPSLGELYGTAPQKLIWIAVSGIVQYALSVWLYLAAIRRIEPQQAALYLNLIPLFGLSCSILFLQERLLAIQWCGAVIVLASLVFRTGRRRAIVLRP
jgi:drug/metabolite transporter (DMT)-like permease